MKIFWSLILLIPEFLLAAACCLGGGPKSFVQLRPLQSYELGLSSSFKDAYGRYDTHGEIIGAAKNQSYTTAVGGTARLSVDADIYLIVPSVLKVKESLNTTQTRLGLGDMVGGVRYHLLDNLFEDEWYPKLIISVFLKVPTGSVDAVNSNGELEPGTGNGIFEPGISITAQKDYGFVILGVSPSYTSRMGRTLIDLNRNSVRVNDGDRIEVSESMTFPVSRVFSAVVGATQSWDLAKKLNGQTISDSHGRAFNGFLSASYFMTRFWSVGFSFDASIPISGFGMNQEANRTVTLTTNYSIF